MSVARRGLPVAAPSPALLNFLRSQSESICFFSPNPRHGDFVFDHAAPRACQPRTRPITAMAISTSRLPSSGSKPLQAGLLNMEFLRPSLNTLSCPSNPSTKRCRLIGAKRQSSRQIRNTSQGWPWNMFAGHRKPQRSQSRSELMPDDLPGHRAGEEGADTMFIGRAMSVKAANEPKLRCTEYDENGKLGLLSGEFKKSELIAKVKSFMEGGRTIVDLEYLVWPSSARLTQDRFNITSPYSHSTFRDPHQSASYSLPDQGRSGSCI